MEAQLITRRCDHCRKSLGLIVKYYWRMQFCSAECVKAYQCRLEEGTLAKIRNANAYDATLMEPQLEAA